MSAKIIFIDALLQKRGSCGDEEPDPADQERGDCAAGRREQHQGPVHARYPHGRQEQQRQQDPQLRPLPL